jgi:hypothetical protein
MTVFSASPAGWTWLLVFPLALLLDPPLQVQVQLQLHWHWQLLVYAAFAELVGIEKKITKATATIALNILLNIVIYILLLKNYVMAPTLSWAL